MKHKQVWMAVFVLVAGLSLWAGAQVADKAVDPVCGMSVATDGAKWTLDYKGTNYYFCCEKCKDAFAKEPEKFLSKKAAEAAGAKKAAGQESVACCPKMAHMQMVKAHAMTPPAAPMAEMQAGEGCGGCCCPMMMKGRMGMKMGHMQMRPGRMGSGMPMGPGMPGMGMGMGTGMGLGMMMEDVEKKIETTKDGVVITITSKNPETVKKIQEHMAQMAKHEAEMMKRIAGDKDIRIEIKEEKK